MFLEAFEKFRAINFTKIDCHVLTDFGKCMDAHDKIKKEITEDWLRMLFSADEEKGWANYANNDKCIANSITTEFWQSRSPGYAHQFITSLVAIFSLVIIGA